MPAVIITALTILVLLFPHRMGTAFLIALGAGFFLRLLAIIARSDPKTK